MKFLRRLRLTIIDLAHHPIILPVHVDPNLDQPSSLAYLVEFSIHVVECGVLTAHSTTHDHLQACSHLSSPKLSSLCALNHSMGGLSESHPRLSCQETERLGSTPGTAVPAVAPGVRVSGTLPQRGSLCSPDTRRSL